MISLGLSNSDTIGKRFKRLMVKSTKVRMLILTASPSKLLLDSDMVTNTWVMVLVLLLLH